MTNYIQLQNQSNHIFYYPSINQTPKMTSDQYQIPQFGIFQRRREKAMFKKVFALPILTLKSQTEPCQQEVQLKQSRLNFFNPHFKLRKMEVLMRQSIIRRRYVTQNQSQTKRCKYGEQVAPRMINSISFQHREPDQSILKSRVLAHIRSLEARSKGSPRNSVTKCPSKQMNESENNQKSIDNVARTTVKGNIFLKCSRLLNQSSPRRIAKKLATIQVKMPIARKRFNKIELNDLSGWEIQTKWHQIGSGTTDSADIFHQNY